MTVRCNCLFGGWHDASLHTNIGIERTFPRSHSNAVVLFHKLGMWPIAGFDLSRACPRLTQPPRRDRNALADYLAHKLHCGRSTKVLAVSNHRIEVRMIEVETDCDLFVVRMNQQAMIDCRLGRRFDPQHKVRTAIIALLRPRKLSPFGECREKLIGSLLGKAIH